jgi:hypothetical protein
MSTKSKMLYYKIFRRIRDRHGLNPTFIHMDFETAERAAAKLAWPDIIVLGCWIHLQRCFQRFAKSDPMLSCKLGNPFIDYVLKLYKVLALVPLDLIPEGVAEIYDVQVAFGVYEDYTNFNEYFMKQWVEFVGPVGWNVSHLKHRTTNHLEGTNFMLKTRLASRQNVFIKICALLSVLREGHRDYLFAKERGPGLTIKSRSRIDYDELQESVRQLRAGEILMLEFLNKWSWWAIAQ